MRAFFVIWAGQFIAEAGAELTWFALGLWAYQETGSVNALGLVLLIASSSRLAVFLFAGVAADRWRRRTVMIVAALLGLLSSSAMLALFSVGALGMGSLRLTIAVSAGAWALGIPAYNAAVPRMVSREQLGRANGLTVAKTAIAQVIAPAAGGALLASLGLRGIIAINVLTRLFALGTLLVTPVPEPAPGAPSPRRGPGRLLHDLREGFQGLRHRRGLLGLLGLIAGVSFNLGVAEVLFTPLILSFASPVALGVILSSGGAGMVASSVVMTVWKGPRRRMVVLLAAVVAQGVMFLLGGLTPSVRLASIAVFGFSLTLPVIIACNTFLWQVKIPAELQGRIFALRDLLGGLTMPLGYAVAGPLADRVFEPLVQAGGPLAGSAGALIGVGPGRGIGLFFIVLGGLTLLAALLAALSPRTRRLELEIPDARDALDRLVA